MIEERDWEKIALLWVQGAELCWEKLYKKRPQRISLPLYPFAKKWCWVKTNEGVLPVTPTLKVSKSSVEEKRVESELNQGMVVEQLKRILAEQLKLPLEDMQENVDFSKWGMNSISMGEFVRAVQEEYGDDLSLGSVLEHRTLNGLSRHLEEVSFRDRRGKPRKTNGQRSLRETKMSRDRCEEDVSPGTGADTATRRVQSQLLGAWGNRSGSRI